MKKIVGIFMDKSKIEIIYSELKNHGYQIRKIGRNNLKKLGLPKELLPIYKSKIKDGGIMIEVNGGREILEDHGAEQIRTV